MCISGALFKPDDKVRTVLAFFTAWRGAACFDLILSDGIPSCIYCFVSKYKCVRLCASCGHEGVFGNSFNLGHTPERGQRPHMSSQPPVTLLGSPCTLMRRFFFSASFYRSQFKWGFPYIPNPDLIYTTLIITLIVKMHGPEYLSLHFFLT